MFGIFISLNSVAQTPSLKPVPFHQVKIADQFWAPRQKVHATTTLKTGTGNREPGKMNVWIDFNEAEGLYEKY